MKNNEPSDELEDIFDDLNSDENTDSQEDNLSEEYFEQSSTNNSRQVLQNNKYNEQINNLSENNNNSPLSKTSSNYSNLRNKNISDEGTKEKLNNIRNNNISKLNNLSNKFSHKKNQEEDSKAENLKDKMTPNKATKVLSGGANSGRNSAEVAKVAKDTIAKYVLKKNTLIIAIPVFLILFLLIIILVVNIKSDESDTNNYGNQFINDEISDEEFINSLVYMGICEQIDGCKDTYAYKFYVKIKELKKEYEKACELPLENDKPCDLSINTVLLMETASYAKTDDELFDEDWTPNQEEDISKLFLAQAEYVEEHCSRTEDGPVITQYYYQISFDKYISYLKYGQTSTHPNYSGEPNVVNNEICVGPVDDYFDNTSDINSNQAE